MFFCLLFSLQVYSQLCGQLLLDTPVLPATWFLKPTCGLYGSELVSKLFLSYFFQNGLPLKKFSDNYSQTHNNWKDLQIYNKFK